MRKLHQLKVVHKVIQLLQPIEARLFISGDEEITSAESSTQGDPTAMPIYALGSLPLLNMTTTDNTKYATYADDISCAGKLKNIPTWWNKLNTFGPKLDIFQKQKNRG